jgi:rRNA processing protein Gar1
LGNVLHLSNNKNLILRTKTKVKIRTPVLSDKLNQIGIIIDIFGPVNNPYVSLKPTVSNPVQYVGRLLYTMNNGET